MFSQIKRVGFQLRVKSNPRSIRGCKNTPFIEITFSNGQGFLKEKSPQKVLTNADLEFFSEAKIRFHLQKAGLRNSKEALQIIC